MGAMILTYKPRVLRETPMGRAASLDYTGVWICEEPQMAHINIQLMYAIFNSC
jgi:hypothetical protein